MEIKDKYIRFTSEYPHYQVEKFNGTKGLLQMLPDNVGVYNESKDTYVFEAVNGIVPEFISDLLWSLKTCGKTVSYDGIHKSKFYDEDHKRHVENFEKRLFLAKTQLDIDWAWIQFAAAEEDRLSIKLSVMKLMSL